MRFAVIALVVALAGSAAAFPMKNLTAASALPAMPTKNWTALTAGMPKINKTDPARALPAPAFQEAVKTNATLNKIQALVNKTGYPVLIGKNANTTAATWNKIAVVDTWLNKTYLPKANQTGPLAGASSIAAQKANNAYKTTAYVYNATAHKVVLAIAAKANLTRTPKY